MELKMVENVFYCRNFHRLRKLNTYLSAIGICLLPIAFRLHSLSLSLFILISHGVHREHGD